GGRSVIFHETDVKDAFLIELELRSDDRGFFARSYCANEFAEHGLEPAVVQANVSFNHKAGTLRGMHYQLPPAADTKLVRCTSGAIHDVIVDLRPESPTYLRHVAVDLTAENRLALYVPKMFAHGYLTLTDGAEVTYQVSEFYTPGQERGIRYDDPALGLSWPRDVSVVSEQARSWPAYEPDTAVGAA